MTTTFYASSISRNVDIPNDRVCGYKVKNYNTRTGWSSSVRADRDNGIVSQKLHRFATDMCSTLKQPCSGNTNWLNGNAPEFKDAGGTGVYTFRSDGKPIRKSFKEPPNLPWKTDENVIRDMNTLSISGINRRNGLGNRDITRNNFNSTAPASRKVGFNKITAVDTGQFPTTIELGAKTLKELFKVSVPDSTDIQWLTEEARLSAQFQAQGMTPQQIKRELKVNKPLGRGQRTTSETRSVGQASLNNEQKLKELSEEVKEGRAEGQASQANILAQLAPIVTDVGNMEHLTRQQTNDMNMIFTRLTIASNHKQFGLPRLIDGVFYDANESKINMFIYANVPSDPPLNYAKPLWSVAGNQAGVPTKLSSAVQGMVRGQQGNKRYLDLDSRTVMKPDQAKQVAQNIDRSEINVSPENALELGI